MAKNGDGVLVDGSVDEERPVPGLVFAPLAPRAVHRRHDGGSAALEKGWRSAIAGADGSTCHGGWAGAGGACSCLRRPSASSPAAADARAVASKRAMTDVTAPTASSLNLPERREKDSARAVVRAPTLFVGQSAGWRKAFETTRLLRHREGLETWPRAGGESPEFRGALAEFEKSVAEFEKSSGAKGAGDGMCPGGECAGGGT